VQSVPVVALVASAGGLNALSRVLAGLPASLQAAVLIAQHLGPGGRSALTEILAGTAGCGCAPPSPASGWNPVRG